MARKKVSRKEAQTSTSEPQPQIEADSEAQGIQVEAQAEPQVEAQSKIEEEGKAEAQLIQALKNAQISGDQKHLTIIYYEVQKQWPVPQKLLNVKMSRLLKDPRFKEGVDEWLDVLGLPEEVGVERNLHPDTGDRLLVSKFLKEGGFVAYRPDQASTEHPGLLHRQALKNKGKELAESSSKTKDEVSELREKVASQEGKVSELETKLMDLNRVMSSTLGAAEAFFKQRLIEAFRIKVAELDPDAVWSTEPRVPDATWWSSFVGDPASAEFVNEALGLSLDMDTLAMSRYGEGLQGCQMSGAELDPEVYTNFVCQYRGPDREHMLKMCGLVFPQIRVQLKKYTFLI